MFPRMRQRLLIGAAIVLGALCLLLVRGRLRAADGSPGLTLMEDGIARSLQSVLLIAAAGLPAMALGLVTSATGNPLSGVFAVAAALGVLAWCGGPIDGFLQRSAGRDGLPDAYGLLLVEVLVWQVAVLLMLMLIQHLRSPLRARWPALAFDDHLGVDTHIRLPQLQALGGGLVCAVVSGIVAWICIRSSDSGQVVWSLLIAFMIGGMVGQMSFPHNNPAGILFSPALVAMVAYGAVLLRYQGSDEVLQAWFNLNLGLRNADRIPGPALALPIHYVSAGLAGCALGVGWAQGTLGGNTQGEDLEVPEPEVESSGG